jgi:eukaryotic-like serine/threonine-protein kinase
MRAALLVLGLSACTAAVDYDGTSYQCRDGETCPDGYDCVDEQCLIDPGPAAMIDVPESSFTMGCDAAGKAVCEEDAAPPHLVTVSAFAIDPTEVSQLDFWRCVEDGACAAPAEFHPGAQPFFPVTRVSWDHAAGFCAWAGKRLPSEAEWELAARGVAGGTYPWGEDPPDCDRAQFEGCSPEQPVPVDQPAGDASPFGLLGMAGNVAEWVADWYDPAYYADSPARDPTGPETGSERVVRGASFNDAADELVTWKREGDEPTDADDDTGFRCAR